MPLQIIYGKSGCGKTARCFDVVDEILESGLGGVLFIVPENNSLMTEMMLSKRYHRGQLPQINVFSFERLAQNVFSKVGPVGVRYLDDCSKHMMIQKNVREVSNKLTVLAKAAKNADLTAMLFSLFTKFKQYNITPSLLAEAANACSDAALKLKLLDIYLIFDRYNKNFVMPVFDVDDNMTLLCEKINKFNLFSQSHVIIDGITALTPDRLSVVRCLLSTCGSMTVTLTADSLNDTDGSNIFARSAAMARQLFDAARELGVDIMPNIYLGKNLKFQNKPELLHLEQNYFKHPPEIYDKKTNNIEIFAADNYHGEAAAAARLIMRLCREEGYRFRDFAVAARGVEGYAPFVRSVFSEFGIDYYIDEKVPVLQNGYIQPLLKVFDIVINNFSFGSVFEWIKSDYCTVGREEKCLLENYVIQCGSSAKMWKSSEPWSFSGNFDEDDMQTINGVKGEAVMPVTSFAAKFSGRKTAREIATHYAEFLKDINAAEVIKNKIQQFEKDGMPVEAKNLEVSYNCLIETVNKMVLYMGDEYLTFDKFYSILLSGLAACDTGQIPATVDQVQVVDLDRFTDTETKCVIILGVIEGVFPRGYINEDLITDKDKADMEQLGLPKIEDSYYLHSIENYKIYSILTSPTERLMLTYPSADSEGSPLAPSIIINRLVKLFPEIKKGTNLPGADNIDDVEGVIPTFNEMVKRSGTPLWNSVREWYRINRRELYEIARRAESYSNLPLRLYEENVSLLYGDVMNSSISKAEQYAMCSFAYFVKYGLKANPRKENKIEPADAGTFMHEIIEKYSAAAQQVGWDNINPAVCAEMSDKITRSVLDESLSSTYTSLARNKYLYNKTKKIMNTTLWNITEYYQRSSFVPLGYEIGFGGDGDLPPIEIELEQGRKARLTGKIDRADIWRTEGGAFLSIVDYKSSRKDIDYCQVLSGIQIQLPVYINSLCRTLSEQQDVKAIPAAMLYYGLDSPVVTGRGITEEEIKSKIKSELKMRGLYLESEKLEAGIAEGFLVKSKANSNQMERLINTAHKRLVKALQSAAKGVIDINPAKYSGRCSCDYCPYGTVCGFDSAIDGNKYRYIKKISREEFFQNAD